MEISERTRYSQLFGIYKSLLTENQQKIFCLYNEDDIGYSEIAAEFNITRQGVREIILKTQSKLDEYEAGLMVLDNYFSITGLLREILPLCETPNSEKMKAITERINKLIEKLEE